MDIPERTNSSPVLRLGLEDAVEACSALSALHRRFAAKVFGTDNDRLARCGDERLDAHHFLARGCLSFRLVEHYAGIITRKTVATCTVSTVPLGKPWRLGCRICAPTSISLFELRGASALRQHQFGRGRDRLDFSCLLFLRFVVECL